MEAAQSSETFVSSHYTTRCQNPESQEFNKQCSIVKINHPKSVQESSHVLNIKFNVSLLANVMY